MKKNKTENNLERTMQGRLMVSFVDNETRSVDFVYVNKPNTRYSKAHENKIFQELKEAISKVLNKHFIE